MAGSGLSVVDTARVVGALSWATRELSYLLGGWSTVGLESKMAEPQMVVWMATTGRHLRCHADALVELMPDSVLLAELAVVAPPSPEMASWLAGLASPAQGSDVFGSELLIDFKSVIERLVADCEILVGHCRSHCDGALARTVATLVEGLSRDLVLVEALIGDSAGGSAFDPGVGRVRFLPDGFGPGGGAT